MSPAGVGSTGRRLRALAALAVCLCGAPARAGEGQDRLDAFLLGFETYAARFDQTLIDETGRTLEKSDGTVALARPGRFRWDYQHPYAQSIIADGKVVWIYDHDLEQVTRKQVDQAIGTTPALILDSKAAVEEHYAVYELGEEEGLIWVALRPLDRASDYSDVRLGFDDAGLRAMDLKDNLGQITRVRFRDEQLNPTLDLSQFSFTPPPGVDVIDAGAPL